MPWHLVVDYRVPNAYTKKIFSILHLKVSILFMLFIVLTLVNLIRLRYTLRWTFSFQ